MPKSAVATACRGYRSEEYPKGIDVDEALYLSSLIPVERGIVRSIKDCVYGNQEKGWRPIGPFVEALNSYPGLLDIILEIEGVISRRGQHASGIILYNVSPFETNAVMRSPNGDLTTQYDLHRSEDVGDVKFDILVTDISDKISIALDLLQQDGYFNKELTKREIYNQVIHPNIIDLNDNELWDGLASGEILDIFQFDTAIGRQTVKAIKPRSIQEMTAANALLRLTAPEGQDRPFDRYVKFKEDISLWYKEMKKFGLSEEEQKILEPYYLEDYGVPSAQENLMLLVMDKNISHFTLGESNNCRKVLAKKQVSKIPEVKEKFIAACPSLALGKYAWRTMMEPQMSYSFSKLHATPYSFVGVQTLVIAVKYPREYWNTACLIVNSQSIEEEDDTAEELEKKNKTPAYGRIASAIGQMRKFGINIAPPDINESNYTFSPDVKNSLIRYGLKGIVRVGDDLVNKIIENRPYYSIKDFYYRIKPNKLAMLSLIKSGMFDNLIDRKETMIWYIWETCDKKSKLNLQNMASLIKYSLLPQETEEQIMANRVYEFNRYLKECCATNNKEIFKLDERAINFLVELGNDNLIDDGFLLQKTWKKVYDKWMDIFRKWLTDNQQQVLEVLNNIIFNTQWEHDAKGSYSSWEMDSLCFYYHEHELSKVDTSRYGIVNFFDLPEEPVVDKILKRKDKTINLYKLEKIFGTCIDKNKIKGTVTLLTPEGVVEIRFRKEYMALYDKQISQIDENGTKTIVERSWFSKGNMIMVMGIRQGDTFVVKKYKNTIGEQLYHIDKIEKDGTLTLRHNRINGIEEEVND